jgi:iron(III) transport system ATP-binding protein
MNASAPSPAPNTNLPYVQPSHPVTAVPLAVHQVEINYPGLSRPTVKNMTFELEPGHIGCLLGPSGCGKSTLLRAIAGFQPIQQGEINLGARTVSTANSCLPPEKRRIGVVFQDYALFPHLNIQDNIRFGLRHWPAAQQQARVNELLQLVHLEGLAKRFPHELSGGQQQRVALARALAPAPQVMLLDEPFSNLDVELREKLGHEVRDILKTAGITTLLVTHDQYEAFAMADGVGVMQHGEIVQWDTPYRLYHEPASRFVADFVGEGAFVPGWLVHDAPGSDHCSHVDIEIGTLYIRCQCNTQTNSRAAPQAVDVLLRPDDVVHDDASALTGIIERKAFRGSNFLYTLLLPSGQRILTLVPSHHDHAIGQAIGIRLEADHVVTFPRL